MSVPKTDVLPITPWVNSTLHIHEATAKLIQIGKKVKDAVNLLFLCFKA